MISLKICLEQDEWDDYVLENNGHPLQLWGWGTTKALHGWKVERLFAYDMDKKVVGGVQVLIRPLPWPFKALAYVPRGPIIDAGMTSDFLEALANHVKSQYGALALSIEPDWIELRTLPPGWKKSLNTILIPNTLILDLKKSEEELLAAMNKKTRQYIRKSAGEEGVTIVQVKEREELEKCLVVYDQTAKRAGFPLHEPKYYYDIFENLGDASPVFAVYKDGWPLAFLWLAISANTAFELYGGMDEDGQKLRVNYALKWHVIRKIKEWGVERYDMNGLVSDGVSTFKRGFADHEDQLVGTYDKPLSWMYVFWTRVYPEVKKIRRLIKR